MDESHIEFSHQSDVCPFCGYDIVEGGWIEITQFGATQDVACAWCSSKWTNVYHLVSYMPIDVKRSSNNE
jgi:formate dehydrogenase maturation protein FdhE